MDRPSDPITLIIFGASGDLTKRKLIPALFNLYCKKLVPADFKIIGYARRDYDNETFRSLLYDGIQKFSQNPFLETHWENFSNHIHYVQGNLNVSSDYEKLHKYLLDTEQNPTNRLYYLATAPDYFTTIVNFLGEQGMAAESENWRHVVIEKPFGTNLQSARDLNSEIQAVFSEQQVYRIDHYLGKETVQNLLTFRFANAIFEPLWNRNYIDHVQITAAETVSVEHRAGYYDTSGIIRDMFQNHLLQLVALTAMEPPATFNAKSLRDEKVKVLHAMSPIQIENTIWGQYRTYRDSEGVKPDSRTPTFIAVKLFIDNWRWQGVPFYIRSGKSLQTKTTEIALEFKKAPHLMFPENEDLLANQLAICIQPDEGIHLRFATKKPGAGMETEPVNMEFHYNNRFGEHALPDAYERLLLDALKGDASLFARSDEIDRAWELVDPLLAAWETRLDKSIAFYETGSWGPTEAHNFITQDNRKWILGCGEN